MYVDLRPHVEVCQHASVIVQEYACKAENHGYQQFENVQQRFVAWSAFEVEEGQHFEPRGSSSRLIRYSISQQRGFSV